MRLLVNICWMIALGWGILCLSSAVVNVNLYYEKERWPCMLRIFMACASFLLAICFILLSCFI